MRRKKKSEFGIFESNWTFIVPSALKVVLYTILRAVRKTSGHVVLLL